MDNQNKKLNPPSSAVDLTSLPIKDISKLDGLTGDIFNLLVMNEFLFDTPSNEAIEIIGNYFDVAPAEVARRLTWLEQALTEGVTFH